MNERNAISFKEELTMYDVIIIGRTGQESMRNLRSQPWMKKTAIIEKKTKWWTMERF